MSNIDELIKKHSAAREKAADMYTQWIRGIITLAAGMVSILVSLKQEKSETYQLHILFIFTIALLALCILFGAVVLYFFFFFLEKKRDIHWKHIYERLYENPTGLLFSETEAIPFYKTYKFLFYSSLVLSLLSLVLYASYSDI